MTRPPRDYTPALSAYYARRHPLRPPKDIFSDELLALADFLMAQIDPEGKKPVVYPPMVAEGADVQRSVKPSGEAAGTPGMRYDARRYDDHVRILFQAGYGFEAIARKLEDFDPKTIRRQLVRMGLVEVRPYSKPSPPMDDGPDTKNPVEAAKVALGMRLTERNGSYWLDGRRPIGIKELIEEANRVREARGLRPIVMKGRR